VSPYDLVVGRARGDGHALKIRALELIAVPDLPGARSQLEAARLCFRFAARAPGPFSEEWYQWASQGAEGLLERLHGKPAATEGYEQEAGGYGGIEEGGGGGGGKGKPRALRKTSRPRRGGSRARRA